MPDRSLKAAASIGIDAPPFMVGCGHPKTMKSRDVIGAPTCLDPHYRAAYHCLRPMSERVNLRIPGPTPVPPEVLEAMAHPMVNHRGREFAALIQRVAERLKEFFCTTSDVLILSASGTGGPWRTMRR